MTAQRKDTYFSELEGEQQTEADLWLLEYLRLIIRLHSASKSSSREGSVIGYPQASVDSHNGTGTVRTLHNSSRPHQ